MENYETTSTKSSRGRLREVPTMRFCILDTWSLTRGGRTWRLDMYEGRKATREFPTSRTFLFLFLYTSK